MAQPDGNAMAGAGDTGILATIRGCIREIGADGVGDLAAGLSYRFLLALFPFFIVVGALGAFVAPLFGIENPAGEVIARLAATMPADARSLLTEQLQAVLGEQQAGLLSLGLVGALWAAAGGIGALMRAMNIVYDVPETRPFWRRTAIAVGLTLLSGALMLSAFLLVIAGEALASTLARAVGLGDTFSAIVGVVRWAIMAALIGIAAAFLFWATPDAKLPFRWLTPGAALFIIVWSVATTGFAWYVAHFDSYNATYGALGGLIVLMLWFYISAYVMLAAAELNAIVARRSADPAAVGALNPGDDTSTPAQARAAQGEDEVQSGTESTAGDAPVPLRRGRAERAIGALVAVVAISQVVPRLVRGAPKQ